MNEFGVQNTQHARVWRSEVEIENDRNVDGWKISRLD